MSGEAPESGVGQPPTYPPASVQVPNASAKCLIHREAGRSFEAKRAEQKAKFWLRRVVALEAQAAQVMDGALR
jgi:hypothetical protein